MAGYGYFAHDDPAPPVARSAYQRVTDCGYAGSWWGENIAWGYTTAQSVVNGWLGSPGHKANIENPNFTSTGVGVASNAAGQLYWTQSFGNDSGSTPPPPPPPGGDTQKPTTPTGLAVTATAQTSVQVRWNASSDNVGVTGYGVYVGGTLAGTVSGTAVTVSGLQCGKSYAIGVDAVDAAQNRSAIATITVATAACSSGGADTVAPSAPSGLTMTAASRTSIAIRWLPSGDNVGVTAYRLWRGSTLVGSTTSTSYTFTGLACGRGYQLGVEARDAAGNLSGRTVVTVFTRSCYSWF
jgi:chitodextrinase